ncbi:RNA exonuclease 4-like isoform X2 [Leptotrombidium deliense]|uniref:RNA exonuclease 4-like isoform X2 n=1 Tax=Leptotrombidium deliense TaxID=299467 RepID=A0A443RYI7_9ACAR|nr:RNA exonuclease 4-like isoform X2 [Leptotrombidium deliense]
MSAASQASHKPGPRAKAIQSHKVPLPFPGFMPTRTRKDIEKFGGDICIDVEKIGVWNGGYSKNGNRSYDLKAGRVTLHSMYNIENTMIHDVYLRPNWPQSSIKYMTEYSGLKAEHLLNGIDRNEAFNEIRRLINGRMLIGASLKNDLESMDDFAHPIDKQWDVQDHYKRNNGQPIRLSKLAEKIFDAHIQQGVHDPIHDARYTFRLYQLWRNQEEFIQRFNPDDYE